MNLIERAKQITLQPATEWPVIAEEAVTVPGLYTSYIAPLAAITPVASFIGMSVIGVGIPFFGSYHVPFFSGIVSAVMSFAIALASIYILALLTDALSPSFGGQRSFNQAFKLMAYSFTPAWLAGILHLIPALGMLAVLASLYSIYVLYLGIPTMMQVAKDKAAGFTAAIVACAIGIGIVTGIVTTAVVGASMLAGNIGHFGLSSGSDKGTQDLSAVTAEIEAASKRMEAANKRMEAAQKSGDPQAQMAAAGDAIGAAMGGDGTVEVVDAAKLKALLGENIAGLPRSSIETEKTAMGTFQISHARAKYSDANDPSKSIEINVSDLGGNKLFGTMFAWGLMEQEIDNEQGYEKMGKLDGRPMHEKISKDKSTTEFSVLVANRFVVETHGHGVDVAQLQTAAATMYSSLEGMKNEGVKKL